LIDALLVIGGSGLVGGALVALARARGVRVASTHRSRAPRADRDAFAADVADDRDRGLERAIAQVRPSSVVYCAVAPNRSAPELQSRVAVYGARRALGALGADAPNARFVYVSTNAVFGAGSGPYCESDPPEPERRRDPYRDYALAKAEGERVVGGGWPDAVVARTSVVDGVAADGSLSPRADFLLSELRAGRPLARFSDRIFSPTGLADLAAALLELADSACPASGILHVAGPDPVSDYAYARRLALHAGVDPALVRPTFLRDAGELSAHPRDTSLDVARARSLLHTQLGGVDAQIDALLAPRLAAPATDAHPRPPRGGPR
jgi:dTDP-4-dehydrorhamnose reductase